MIGRVIRRTSATANSAVIGDDSMNVTRMSWAAAASAALVAAALAGPSGEHDAVWVERRVEEMQPTSAERAIDRIGWAADLRSALRLARESGRPVFLFTMDGRFSIGRC
jgi:hypothetical protein